MPNMHVTNLSAELVWVFIFAVHLSVIQTHVPLNEETAVVLTGVGLGVTKTGFRL